MKYPNKHHPNSQWGENNRSILLPAIALAIIVAAVIGALAKLYL
jgi:hypothetical protein